MSGLHIGMHMIDTGMLLALVVAASVYLNEHIDARTDNVTRFAVVLVSAGALGAALELWIATDWPDFGEIILHSGCLLLVVHLLRERARCWWDGRKRRVSDFQNTGVRQ